jgi:hypothetical protein
MYNGLERRKYKRIEKPYTARFKIRSDAQETESDDWDSVTLHSLRAGGTFFIYKKDLGIDTLLDFKIEVSKSKPPVNPVGKVIRIEQFQLPPYSMFCIAIKFTEIGEHEKEAINTAVEKDLVQDNRTSVA